MKQSDEENWWQKKIWNYSFCRIYFYYFLQSLYHNQLIGQEVTEVEADRQGDKKTDTDEERDSAKADRQRQGDR